MMTFSYDNIITFYYNVIAFYYCHYIFMSLHYTYVSTVELAFGDLVIGNHPCSAKHIFMPRKV